jgi:hypothetical protein
MATPDDIPSMATKPFTMPSPPDDILSMPSNEHLALDHVLENILGIPITSSVRSAFTAFWIFTIDDLMNIKPRHDLQEEYTYSKVNDKGDKIETYNKLPPMLIRNIELLQQWYFEHTFPDTRVWFTLNESKFNNWKVNRFHGTGNKDLTTPTPTPTPSTITMATTPIPINEASTFLRSIKRSPSDYTKFKDDTRWKQWHRHLKATANSHGISHILDPAYVPLTDNARELFQVQQTFMYSVFEQCMHTNKSRHVVQTFESTADAQGVYAGLLQAYEEDLSNSLAATDLRSELTLLRFDDKWKKSNEAFLLSWKSKILELEQLEDKKIEDATKRLWLTATLSTKTHMAHCLSQAKVTEMPQPCSGMDSTTSSLHMQNYRIIQSPTPQLKSKPMFMNRVAAPAVPVEEDEVVALVVAEGLVAVLLQPLPTPI